MDQCNDVQNSTRRTDSHQNDDDDYDDIEGKSKKPKIEENELYDQHQQEQLFSKVNDHANAMKVAGFSLSAIEEMKNQVAENKNSQILDEQLRQFQVLDEVGSNTDDDNDDADYDKNICVNGVENDVQTDNMTIVDYDAESSELDLDDEEIEHLLDENLPDDLKTPKKPKYEERFKTVLEEKRHNHFEVLPEGWVQVTHNSGMPLYLHRKTRVISTSRPYFLGTGSARKHAIPVGSVPCLNYKRALDEEALLELQKSTQKPNKPDANEKLNSMRTQTNNKKCPFSYATINTSKNENNIEKVCIINSEEPMLPSLLLPPPPPPPIIKARPSSQPKSTSQNPTDKDKLRKLVPAAEIITVRENIQKESLTPDQFNEYCRKLFKFRVIRVLRFRSWHARRKFTKNRKNLKNIQRPTLPDDTKLIKFPVLIPTGETNSNPRAHKEWIMNPNGKSYVCILHEYVQHALKKQPTYEFKELQNAATPYAATVSINDLKYGTGYGTSKRQAKSEAARETLEILIPEMKDKITGVKQDKSAIAKSNQKDLSVFDDIKIEDPRVAEFCNKTTEPSPHAILLTCLQRNFGLGDDVHINFEINRTNNKKNEFTMTVGKHTAKVLCKNKREGKQLASQAILQILHPHIKTWGSLLRLYGNNSIKTFKEKKLEEQEITVLQSKAAINQPNYAILEKLRTEMLKLAEKNKSVQSKGTFIPSVDLPSSSGSNLNNVEL